MGNGSIHGKDAERIERPPQGARIVGEDGKVTYAKGDAADEQQSEASTGKKPPAQPAR